MLHSIVQNQQAMIFQSFCEYLILKKKLENFFPTLFSF